MPNSFNMKHILKFICLAAVFLLADIPYLNSRPYSYANTFGPEERRRSLIDAELDYVERTYGKSVNKRSSPPVVSSQKNADQAKPKDTSYVQPKDKSSLKPMVDSSKNKLKYKNEYLNFQLEVLGGYRKDNMVWSIAGDETGQNPNILSELTWEDLEMSQTTAKSRVIFFDYFVAEARGSYADIYEGKNQDSDYAGNERTGEFSRSNNRAHDGETFDIEGSFGFRFPLKSDDDMLDDADNAWVTLMGGYSHHEQHLVITDGFQSIPAFGEFDDLNSRYTSEWKGPFVGLEFEARKEKLSGFIRGEYHWVDYYGVGNWNLREEVSHPRSFEHIAKGKGLVLNLGGGYQITNWWEVNVEGTLQRWTAGPGIDRTFFFNDAFILETQFNEVTWNSYSVMLGTTLSLF